MGNFDPLHLPERFDAVRYRSEPDIARALADLAERCPAIVIDTAPANIHGWAKIPLETCEPIARFVREHYVEVTSPSPDPGNGNRPLGKGWYADALIPFSNQRTGSRITTEGAAAPFESTHDATPGASGLSAHARPVGTSSPCRYTPSFPGQKIRADGGVNRGVIVTRGAREVSSAKTVPAGP